MLRQLLKVCWERGTRKLGRRVTGFNAAHVVPVLGSPQRIRWSVYCCSHYLAVHQNALAMASLSKF